MANTSRKGIFPTNRDQDSEHLFIVDSGNGTNLGPGDVVSMVAAGAVNKSAAGDANIVVGTVMEIFDATKIPCGAPNSTVSTKYLPLSTAGYALIALALPGRKFIAQTDTILTVAAIGASTDHVVGTLVTTTGQSANTINGNDLNTGGQVFIIGAVNDPTNDITLANAKWLVIFNEGIFMGTGKAVGV